MKKFLSILSILSVMMFLASCGSDTPDNLPVSMKATASKDFTMVAAAGNTSSAKVTFSMSDFTAISQYVKYVQSASVKNTSSIDITKITTGQNVELTGVKLELTSDSKKSITLPTITANATYNDASQLAFLQQVMDEIRRKGSSEIKLTYTSTNLMTTPVTMTLKIEAEFTFG